MKNLKVVNLNKEYTTEKSQIKVKALVNLKFHIDQGEFVAIMGPSGCGKTTLLNAISGIDFPDSGQVYLSDTELLSMNKNEMSIFRRKEIGIVFQDFNLLDSLTVRENIMVPMVLDKTDLVKMDKKVNDLSQILDINNILDKHIYEISGGEQQRTAICRALANDPAIVLADEPTGNLDSKSANTVMEYFSQINRLYGCTILMVTHDPVSASFCDRVIFLKDGSVIDEAQSNAKCESFRITILETLMKYGDETNDQ